MLIPEVVAGLEGAVGIRNLGPTYSIQEGRWEVRDASGYFIIATNENPNGWELSINTGAAWMLPITAPLSSVESEHSALYWGPHLDGQPPYYATTICESVQFKVVPVRTPPDDPPLPCP